MENQKTKVGQNARKTWSNDDKVAFTKNFATVCATQKLYGKIPDDLGIMIEGFCLAVGHYPVQKIIDALWQYVALKPDIPSPADVRAIIDPVPVAWTPDWPYYNALRDRLKTGGRYGLCKDELDYLRACEEHSMGQFKTP